MVERVRLELTQPFGSNILAEYPLCPFEYLSMEMYIGFAPMIFSFAD